MGWLRKLEKKARKPFKNFVRTGLPGLVLGGLTGMPWLGVGLSTGLGGASRNSHNRFPGLISGFGNGMLANELGGFAADQFGFTPGGFMHRISGAGNPSLMHGIIDGAPGSGGGTGLFGYGGNEGILRQGMQNGFGWKDSLFGKMGEGVAAAAGKGLMGMMGGKQPQQEGEEEQQEEDPYGQRQDQSFNNQYQNYSNLRNGEDPLTAQLKNSSRLGIDPMDSLGINGKKSNYSLPPDYFKDRNGDKDNKSIHDIHRENLFKKNKNKEKDEIEAIEKIKRKNKKKNRFASGGLIKGNNNSGIADDLERDIPEGSYVANAMVTSLLGDGSTDHGAKRLMEFEAPYLNNIGRSERMRKPVRAFVSNDEYIIDPRTVDGIGKGNNAKGAKILKKTFSNLLKHKGVKRILPPASKSIQSYMR